MLQSGVAIEIIQGFSWRKSLRGPFFRLFDTLRGVLRPLSVRSRARI